MIVQHPTGPLAVLSVVLLLSSAAAVAAECQCTTKTAVVCGEDGNSKSHCHSVVLSRSKTLRSVPSLDMCCTIMGVPVSPVAYCDSKACNPAREDTAGPELKCTFKSSAPLLSHRLPEPVPGRVPRYPCGCNGAMHSKECPGCQDG